ncbi:hypothetical protein HPP92_012704 [Vanilla planifolia]|uniref:Uncharacterized protein n=1 Tax=Vanilla planifolia TaxID=51239 RepID=A0A835UUI7_VANPL|nr:hypothetical protein HPP92_013130 [Vanilla planifolia]KAG0477985.1 hypothetical protein HPP92_012704 [Vanilla planifolia]
MGGGQWLAIASLKCLMILTEVVDQLRNKELCPKRRGKFNSLLRKPLPAAFRINASPESEFVFLSRRAESTKVEKEANASYRPHQMELQGSAD